MTANAETQELTLVLGATGTTGRRVAARLAARLGSRSGQPPFDWADETTWPAALENVTCLLTFEQAIAEIAAATGENIDYQRISAEEFISGLVAVGTPKDNATVFAEIFSTVLDGRNAYLTDGVTRALGRPPRDFAEYARDAAATGVWQP